MYDRYDMYENGLRLIASAIQQKRGDEAPLTANDYNDPFKNEVFYMSAYCWCDGGAEGHEDGCPPNFSTSLGLRSGGISIVDAAWSPTSAFIHRNGSRL